MTVIREDKDSDLGKPIHINIQLTFFKHNRVVNNIDGPNLLSEVQWKKFHNDVCAVCGAETDIILIIKSNFTEYQIIFIN